MFYSQKINRKVTEIKGNLVHVWFLHPLSIWIYVANKMRTWLLHVSWLIHIITFYNPYAYHYVDYQDITGSNKMTIGIVFLQGLLTYQ